MADFREMIKGKQKVDAAAYPAFHVFEETDDWIAGVLSDRREVDTEYGKMRVMTITQDDGTKSSISLSAQLAGLWEMDGKKVVIVYRGKIRNASGKGWTKQFEVYN